MPLRRTARLPRTAGTAVRVASALAVGTAAVLTAAPAGAAPAGAAEHPAAGAPAADPAPGAAPDVRTLHFAVQTGPEDTRCDVVGDLYTPAGASADDPVPAILTTNGFGGSKDDQAAAARYFAGHGYAVLSYSGLGFGGSGCRIGMDGRVPDGQAASQLISFLGGQEGIAFEDAEHTRPVPAPGFIVRDAVDHDGAARAHDPRV